MLSIIYINKKKSEESSRSVCSSDLEDSLGKEQLYRRKIQTFHVWDYYSSNYEIMFIQLYWMIKTNYMQIYIFLWQKRSNINIQNVWTCGN